MAIFDITYIGDMPYLKLTGGTVTGATVFSGDLGATTINGVTVGSSPKFTDTTYSVATTSTDGLMAAADKTAVNKIGTGTLSTTAQTIIPAINELKNTSTNTIYYDGETSYTNNISSAIHIEEVKINSKSNLPQSLTTGTIVYCNGYIHMLRDGTTTDGHYRYNGTSWTSISTLPYSTYYAASTEDANGYIHLLGSSTSDGRDKYHYRFNGSAWTSISTLPYSQPGTAILQNGYINILGSSDPSTSGTGINHYIYNGSSWTRKSTLPYPFYGEILLDKDNYINIYGRYYIPLNYKHYKYNNSSWVSVSTLPTWSESAGSKIMRRDGEGYLHLFMFPNNASATNQARHYKFVNNNWKWICGYDYNFGCGNHCRSSFTDNNNHFQFIMYDTGHYISAKDINQIAYNLGGNSYVTYFYK